VNHKHTSNFSSPIYVHILYVLYMCILRNHVEKSKLGHFCVNQPSTHAPCLSIACLSFASCMPQTPCRGLSSACRNGLASISDCTFQHVCIDLSFNMSVFEVEIGSFDSFCQ
jgi:hypothetical protein